MPATSCLDRPSPGVRGASVVRTGSFLKMGPAGDAADELGDDGRGGDGARGDGALAGDGLAGDGDGDDAGDGSGAARISRAIAAKSAPSGARTPPADGSGSPTRTGAIAIVVASVLAIDRISRGRPAAPPQSRRRGSAVTSGPAGPRPRPRTIQVP